MSDSVSPHTIPPGDFLRVSYSSLNLFDSCARKFEFTKMYPRRARNTDMFAADVGTALHKGYQEYLVSQDSDRALWEMLKAYPHELSWDQDNDFRSVEAATITLDEMIESTHLQGWEIAKIKKPNGETVPAIEVPFEIRIDGLRLPDGRGIAFTGFIDAIMKHRTMDHFRTLDIKTHRRVGKDEGHIDTIANAKYKFDTQQLPYGIVLEHIQGRPVDRFEVLYYDVFVDICDSYAKVYSYWKDALDTQEWLTGLVMKCQRLIQYAEMDFFPRTDGGCLSFNKPCYYLGVCESRNRQGIEAWFLEGQQPAHPEYTEPWILGTIHPFAGIEDQEELEGAEA